MAGGQFNKSRGAGTGTFVISPEKPPEEEGTIEGEKGEKT